MMEHSQRFSENHKELKVNGSGIKDQTAEKAIRKVIVSEKHVSDVIKTIQSVAHISGFEIEGRIVLKDKTTGKVWR